MSKSFEKKKQYRRNIKKAAKQHLINDASGRMVPRNGNSSMYRDYMPNR